MLTAAKKQLPNGPPSGWALFNAKTHNLARPTASRADRAAQAQVLNDIHLRAQPTGRCGWPCRTATAAGAGRLPGGAGTRDGLVPLPRAAARQDRDREPDLERQAHRPERQPDRVAAVQERRRHRLPQHHPRDLPAGTSPREPPAGTSSSRSSSTTRWSRADGESARIPDGIDADPQPGSEITGVTRRRPTGSRSRSSRARCRSASRCCPRSRVGDARQGRAPKRPDRRHRRPDLRDDLPAGRLRVPGPDRRHRPDHLRPAAGRDRCGPAGDDDPAGDRRHDPHDRRRRRREHRHLRTHQGGGARRQDRSAPRSRPATGAASTRSSTPTWSR